MIFTTDEVFAARSRILAQMEDGSIPREQGWLRALEMDPFAKLPLLKLTAIRFTEGNRSDAAGYGWRALQAHPCDYRCYMLLAHILDPTGDGALSKGIIELGFRKVLDNPETLKDYQESMGEPAEDEPPTLLDYRNPDDLRLIARLIEVTRQNEPPAVTEQLRPYRLIHQVQCPEHDGLTRDVVDEIVRHGAECGPLLIGVLRGWAEDDVPEGDEFVVEAALALLGEIGDPATLPDLLEFLDIEDDEIASAAEWAIRTIARRHPQETFEALRRAADGADHYVRCLLASLASSLPGQEGVSEFLLAFLSDLDQADASTRDALFQIVASSLLITEGERGPQTIAALLDRWGHLVPRKTLKMCREVVADPGAFRQPFPMIEEDLTVYDFCCPKSDKEEPDLPLARPGRNDPCWCGSGTKYKKCHVAQDETQEISALRALHD